jgi:hypothetical protein
VRWVEHVGDEAASSSAAVASTPPGRDWEANDTCSITVPDRLWLEGPELDRLSLDQPNDDPPPNCETFEMHRRVERLELGEHAGV